MRRRSTPCAGPTLRRGSSRWPVVRRPLLLTGVFLSDTGLALASDAGPPMRAMPGYAAAALLVIALGRRWPVPVFIAALTLDAATGGGYVLVIWTAYQAGQAVASRPGVLALAGAALGWLAVQFLDGPTNPTTFSNHIVEYLALIAVPLLTGQYLAQQQRLLRVLGRQNHQLRRNQELLAERERLRERLRIARDMHDSLGRRLSLVSIQAAALEVSSLPPAQDRAVRQLAEAARSAVEELHDLVGALRTADDPGGPAADVRNLGPLVQEFRAAGVAVALHQRGVPHPLACDVAVAGYRFVEEGLANAAKHAPGQPVSVHVDWEPDALLLSVENPLPPGRSARSARPSADETSPVASAGCRGEGNAATAEPRVRTGHGIAGLGERIRLTGGLVDHTTSAAGFRLFAIIPVTGAHAAEPATADEDPALFTPQSRWPVSVGAAAAVLAFVIVPAVLTIFVGVTVMR